MKKGWGAWWIATIFWFVLFVIGSIFVWVRDVDGAGVTQTPLLKLVAFIVLLMAFMIPLSIQVVWLIVKLRKSNSEKVNV
nr:DUF3923 family protein [Paenibacillus bovis]